MEDTEQMQEESNILVLTDEDGNDVSFELLDIIPYEDVNYVVMVPAEEQENAQVVIFAVEEGEDEENDSFATVEDERILNAVYDIFKERFQEVFTFLDGEE